MNKKSKSEAIEKAPEDHQAIFEKLPEETKELMKLKNQKERVTGSEQVVVTREIEEKARKSET
jgi:hypothetical protein